MRKILLAVMLLTTVGFSDIAKDITACNGGDMASCNKVGVGYGTGEGGVDRNTNKAREYFNKACDGDNFQGCTYLGFSYVEEKNYLYAMKYFTKACNGGHAEGCSNLGTMYSQGDGTKQDYFKSVKYYKKACDGNYAWSCYKLGIGHYGGYAGCSQSFPKAKALFNKACKGGIPMACDRYAEMKKNGL